MTNQYIKLGQAISDQQRRAAIAKLNSGDTSGMQVWDMDQVERMNKMRAALIADGTLPADHKPPVDWPQAKTPPQPQLKGRYLPLAGFLAGGGLTALGTIAGNGFTGVTPATALQFAPYGAAAGALGGFGAQYLMNRQPAEKQSQYTNLGTKAAQYNGWSDANKLRLGGGLAGAGMTGLGTLYDYLTDKQGQEQAQPQPTTPRKHWYSNLKYMPIGAGVGAGAGGLIGGSTPMPWGMWMGAAGGAPIGALAGGVGSAAAYIKDLLSGEKYAYVNLGTKAAQYNGWSDANKLRLGGGLAGAGIGGLASYLGGGSALKGGLAGGALGYGAAEAYNHRDQIDPIVQDLITKLKTRFGGQQELQGPTNPNAESQFNGGASLGPGPQ